MLNIFRSSMMTSESAAARLKDRDEANPKIDSALNSNTDKEPDDRVSGGDPMNGRRAPTLKPSRRNATRQPV
jgi:hypothetical protein